MGKKFIKYSYWNDEDMIIHKLWFSRSNAGSRKF